MLDVDALSYWSRCVEGSGSVLMGGWGFEPCEPRIFSSRYLSKPTY
jgi:hypothetical protein